GTCAEPLLNSYSPERSGVGDEVLKSAGHLTTVGTLKNPILQSLRNRGVHVLFGLSAVRQTFADSMTEMSIGYPNSPLNGKIHRGNSAPKPGERVMLVNDENPLGAGLRPLFALFAEQSPGTTKLLAQFPDLL